MTDTNSLPDILARQGAGPGARALDIGGAAYFGEESTRYLCDRSGQPVDVVAPRSDLADAMLDKFGPRVRILDCEYDAEEGAYDVVVISPTLVRLTDNLRELHWRGQRLVKPGGLLITFGIDPAALGVEGYKQPEPAVLEGYRTDFLDEDGQTLRLSSNLDEVFELAEVVSRKPGVRSYLTWMVLRRRPVLFPIRAAIDVTGGLDRADRSRAPSGSQASEIDTLLVAPGLPTSDQRTRRIHDTLLTLGRKVLCVRDETDAEEGYGPEVPPQAVLTNPRRELERRLHFVGAEPDEAKLAALHVSVRAAQLTRLLEDLIQPGLVIHSAGALALAVVAEGLDRLASVNPGKRRQVRWLHDVRDHEGAADADALLAAADGLTTSGRPAAFKISGPDGPLVPTVLWDSPRLSDRFRYRGKTVRQKTEISAVIITLTGPFDGREGVIVEALQNLSDMHLVLVGSMPAGSLKALRKRAVALGVAERVHLSPAPGLEGLPGFLADADLGVVLADAGCDADAGIFVHALSGIPTVAIGTSDLLQDWGVGEAAETADPVVVAATVRKVLEDRDRYVRAINRRPDLLLDLSWEVQASRLASLYAQLHAPIGDPAIAPG